MICCPECGSDRVTLIYGDPETYQCDHCGAVFDREEA